MHQEPFYKNFEIRLTKNLYLDTTALYFSWPAIGKFIIFVYNTCIPKLYTNSRRIFKSYYFGAEFHCNRTFR